MNESSAGAAPEISPDASPRELRTAIARLEREWEVEQGRHLGPVRSGWTRATPVIGVPLLLISLFAAYVAVAMVAEGYLTHRPLIVLAAAAMALAGLAGSWMHLAGSRRLREGQRRFDAERAALLARLAAAVPPPDP